MKSLIGKIIVATVLAAPELLFADTIVSTVGYYGPWQTGSGGEFTLQTFDPTMNAIANSYYSGAMNQVPDSIPNFQTFCVEAHEFIYPNTTFAVTFNNHSIYTAVPLTVGAAWLYNQFATGGNFGGNATYDYLNTGVGRHTTADELQRAIWALMGGQEGQTEANNAGNPFLAAAETHFGGTFAGADAVAATGQYGVYVLNLWAPNQVGGAGYQDQLVWSGSNPIPNVVPDGGATVILLGMGLTGLGLLRRFRVRQ